MLHSVHFVPLGLILTGTYSPALEISNNSQSDFPTAPEEIYAPCNETSHSGLGYTTIKAGKGRKVTSGVFTITYQAFVVPTQTRFADLKEHLTATHNYTFKPIFAEAIASLRVGDIKKFCYPSSLAFGDKKVGPIPPNSDLIEIFEVHAFTSSEEIEKNLRAFQR